MASLNDFDGVDAQGRDLSEQIAQRGGQAAVFNEPGPFVIPSSKNTASTVESYDPGGPVPTGSLSPYLNYDPEGPSPGNLLYGTTGDEDPENAQAVALNTPFTPSKTENVFLVEGVPKGQQVLINPLHDYEDYTYNLSLHAITTEQFNNLAESPDGYIPQNVLIAGAGKYSDKFKRNIHFEEDFYFDDLKMRTVVNTTKRNKFSNLVELNFKIIEPNGFTLIQRLINACESPVSEGGVGGLNYLKQPFILQIDFYGSRNGEVGAGIIPDQTKIIPIRLVGMKTRIGVNGTEYNIEATPFNHIAFDPRNIVLPAAFTMKAATVKDLFGTENVNESTIDTITQRYQNEQEELARRQAVNLEAQQSSDSEFAGLASSNNAFAQTGSTTLGQFGVANGYNSWHRTLARRSLNGNDYKPNFINFVIDPEIANSSFYKTGGPIDISVASDSDSQSASARQAGGLNVGQIQFAAGTITMPAGTSIQSIVKWAISNSDYMRKQLLGVSSGFSNSTRQTQLQEPLKFVKIIPRIKVLAYDKSRQDFQYEITYFIRKYLMNSRSPNAPQGRVKGWVKEYNWIYTGGQSPYTSENLSNKDVIDLQLDFNMLFYTALTAFKDNNKLFNTGKFLGDEPLSLAVEASGFSGDPNNPAPLQPNQEARPDNQAQDRIARAPVHYWSGNQDSKRTGSQQTAVQAVSDVINNTQLEARGDMINVKLTILGDPHFIKQDDIFYNIGTGNKNSQLTPNNSLFMDDGELYVFINFRSPVDYDESTGLAIPFANRYSYSEFTGVYKIITVENSFTKGKFIQILDLVRLSVDDSKRVLAVQQAFRQQNTIEVGAGQLVTFPNAGGNLGQRIAGTVFSGGLLAGGTQLVNSLVSEALQSVQQEITREVAGLVEDIGTDIFEGVGDVITDIGESLGLIDNVSDVIDFEIGDANVLAGIPEVDWTGFGDVIGW